MMRRILAVLSLSAWGAFALYAAPGVEVRELENEARARITAGVSYKPVKGLTLKLSEQLLLKENFATLDRLNTDAEAHYKVCRYLRVGVSYRFMAVYKAGADLSSSYWTLRHRAACHVTGMYTVNRWQLSLRERFQSTWRDEELTNLRERRVPEFCLRTRFKAEYHCFSKPLQPYASLELYSPLGQTDYLAEAEETTGYRHWAFNAMYTRVGLQWRLDARNFLDFSYCLAAARKVDVGKKSGDIRVTPSLEHIVGVAYSYHF